MSSAAVSRSAELNALVSHHQSATRDCIPIHSGPPLPNATATTSAAVVVTNRFGVASASCALAPENQLAPLVHSLSYPNIGTASAQSGSILKAIQRQSLHRNSLQPALGYTPDKLGETLQKIQQTAAVVAASSSSSSNYLDSKNVLKKLPNEDLIDLDLIESPERNNNNSYSLLSNKLDLLQMFDPLTAQSLVTNDLNGVTTTVQQNQSSTNVVTNDAYVPTFVYKKSDTQRRSSSASIQPNSGQNVEDARATNKDTLTRSNSLDSKVSTCSSIEDNQSRRVSFRLPDNSNHVHKRTAALWSKSLCRYVCKLRRLRAAHPHNDALSNSGFVIGSRLYSQSDSAGSVRLRVYTPFDGQPTVFTCSLSTSVEHVICHLVCGAPDYAHSKPEFDQFALRLHSLDEYLLPECSLGEFAFVQKCHKRRKSVPLELVQTTKAAVRRYARTADDDRVAALITPFDVQPTELVHKYVDVNYNAIRILLDTLDAQCNRLLKPIGRSGLQSLQSAADHQATTQTASDSAPDSNSAHALLKSVLQSVKALCITLDGLETIQLSEALTNLSELYLLCAQHRMSCVNAQLNVTIDRVYPEVIGSAVLTLKKAIYEMLSLYCQLYPVNFDVTIEPRSLQEWEAYLDERLHLQVDAIPSLDSASNQSKTIANPDENNQIMSSADVQDTLLIKIENVCALQCDWISKHSAFVIQCDLVHGVRRLATARTETVHVQQGICPRLEVGSYIQFETLPICAFPRECKLMITLYGCASSTATTINNEVDGSDSEALISLGITCLPMFDEQRSLQKGDHLLGFWNEKYAEPSWRPLINGPCRDRRCALLVMNIVSNEHQTIQFPPFDPIDSHIDWDLWLNNRKPLPVVPKASKVETIDSDLLYASTVAQRQLHQLDPVTQEQIYQMLTRDPLQPLTGEHQRMLWERRNSLLAVPSALAHVLSAVDSWAPNRLNELYQLIDSWDPLPALDAIQLLLPDFADCRVRALAVQSLDRLPDDELLDLLPQLVNTLCFESSPDCALSWLLLRRSLCSVRLAHAFYWLLKDAVSSHPMDYRLEIQLQSLLSISGKAFNQTIQNQSKLLQLLDSASERLRSHKCNKQLLVDLALVQDFIAQQPLCLPLNAGTLVHQLHLNMCTYFHSNSLPVKLVFGTETILPIKDATNPSSMVHALYKLGDDLRQDALTMQVLSIMDKLWLKEGLDLKLVTFQCVPTGYRKGFIQMVKNAETLRRIQGEKGVTGSFRDNTIYQWLRKHNPTDLEYGQAVFNFTHSCAGYAVATYILGIGDRHNDNIMLTPSGQLFHIDFGKFLGDAQMLGSIRRDRVPFVLTSDMAYVINGGERPNARFQQFIDLCCQAYNILRRHCNLFLSLFSLMLGAGIAGVTPNAIRYVHDALRPSLTDSKACEAFNRLIAEALRSRSTQINFFIHNLAQMRFSSDMQSDDDSKLSFATRTISAHSQTPLQSVHVLGVRRGRMDGQKVCFYVLKIDRGPSSQSQHVKRTHKEHFELREKLLAIFRLVRLPPLSRPKAIGSREVAEKRRTEIESFWNGMMQMASEILHSDLVYTFLQTLERDQTLNEKGTNKLIDFEAENGDTETADDPESLQALEEQLLRLARMGAGDWQMDALMDAKNTSAGRKTLNRNACGLTGEIKLSLSYQKHSLLVMVMHAKNLQSSRYTSPDTYVKTYLIPDPYKSSKRKTRVCSRNAHPTFLEMIAYEMPFQQLLRHTLCVSVWDYDSLGENLLIGRCDIELCDANLESGQEIVSWYPLEYKDWRSKDYR